MIISGLNRYSSGLRGNINLEIYVRIIIFIRTYCFIMAISVTSLRANIYKILDQVLETGIPVEIKRKGKIITIIPPEKTDKLKNLKNRKILNCDPNEIIHMDWSKEWKGL